jgi:hypothetical protein
MFQLQNSVLTGDFLEIAPAKNEFPGYFYPNREIAAASRVPPYILLTKLTDHPRNQADLSQMI